MYTEMEWWTRIRLEVLRGEVSKREVLLNETVMTLPNGFMELWLPRNRKIELTIKRNELSSIGVIDTFDSSKTCVTTFKLQ